jgi:hypothetical protein
MDIGSIFGGIEQQAGRDTPTVLNDCKIRINGAIIAEMVAQFESRIFTGRTLGTRYVTNV